MGRLGDTPPPNGRAQERPAPAPGAGDGCGRNHSLALSLSTWEWIEVAKRMELSAQQGDIVRLMLTLPAEDTDKEPGNTNSKIAPGLEP